jgi:hypothetical protein
MTVDLADGRLLTAFGSSDNDQTGFWNVQDLWLLDMRPTTPAWSILETPESSRPGKRLGVLNEAHPNSTRMLIFGGLSYSGEESNQFTYDNVAILDWSQQDPAMRWTELYPPSEDHISNAGNPINRLWADWRWTDETDRTTLFFFGGMGTMNGDMTSANAHDLDDMVQGAHHRVAATLTDLQSHRLFRVLVTGSTNPFAVLWGLFVDVPISGFLT